MDDTSAEELLGHTTDADNLLSHQLEDRVVSPQANEDACACGPGPNSSGNRADSSAFVYAIGRVETRFPTVGVEKEFQQAVAQVNTKGYTDKQVFHAVISEPRNRYLVRQLCWILTIEGLETYILRPRDPVDFALLVDAVRAEPNRGDVDLVIGLRGPFASPEVCNGLTIPIVMFDQIYSFDHDQFIKAIPRPPSVPERRDKAFRESAHEVFDHIMQLADNAGATDEHRALNYLAVRYPAIYTTTADAISRDCALSAVDAGLSRLSGSGKIISVVFSYTNRKTDVIEKYFVRVNVTEEFPFLVTKMSPFYDR